MKGSIASGPLRAGGSYLWVQLPCDVQGKCIEFRDKYGYWPLEVVVPQGTALNYPWFDANGIVIVQHPQAVYACVGPVGEKPGQPKDL